MIKERENEKWGIPFARRNFLSNVIYYLNRYPPLFDQAELWIYKDQGTAIEASIAAFDYIGELWDNDRKESYSNHKTEDSSHESISEKPSKYLYDVIEFFLRFNLDPNFKTDNESLMHRVCQINNKFIAADTLKLLLENGGDPYVLSGNRPLHEILDSYVLTKMDNLSSEIIENPVIQSRIHCWMVLVGFCGTQLHDSFYSSAHIRFIDSELFHIEELKNHNNFRVELVQTPTCDRKMSLSIVSIKTGKEVARLL